MGLGEKDGQVTQKLLETMTNLADEV